MRKNGIITEEDLREQYSFPIYRETLFTKDKLETGRDAVVRSDVNKVIGVVSTDSYKLMTHNETMDMADEVLEQLGGNWSLEKVDMASNGALMFAEYVTPDKYKIEEDDDISPTLRTINSYNLWHSLSYQFGAVRLVCTNGMMAYKPYKALDQIHMGSFDLDRMRDEMEKAFEHFINTSIPAYQRMSIEELASKTVINILNDDNIGYGIKKEFVEQMTADGNLDIMASDLQTWKEDEKKVVTLKKVSQWYAYNILTSILTHKVESAMSRYHNERRISTHFGFSK